MLPVGEKGIRLFVARHDIDDALSLLKEMDFNDANPPEESFHYADLEEIMYQKELHQGKRNYWMVAIIVLMVTLLIAYAILLAANGSGLYHPLS